VTAAFNRNLLLRINRELSGLRPRGIRSPGGLEPEERRGDAPVSRKNQVVAIPRAETTVCFAAGELI
jgi:hypothetical protein